MFWVFIVDLDFVFCICGILFHAFAKMYSFDECQKYIEKSFEIKQRFYAV